MTDEPGPENVTLFACGLLRDSSGRILIVQIGTDAHGRPSWWLPGAQVWPAEGAMGALRTFLAHDLGLRRPEIRGQQFISCTPSASEPGGQFMLLFDCGTIRDDQLDRRRLHAGAFVQDARWATFEQTPALLVSTEFLALALALRHRPAGLCRHLSAASPSSQPSAGPLAAMPRHSSQPGNWTHQPASPEVVMPGISYDIDSRPALPRRAHDLRGDPAPMDWFRSSDQQ